ncbi:MAG: NAD/NADP octopine/nopaline dehydrogenase family protein [Halanaerobiales bacterium]
MKLAVLGAGNGGQAMAAYLSIKGCQINLYNRTPESLIPIKKKGGIDLNGVYNGFGKLNLVTSNIKKAITGVEFILVITPAVAHSYFADQLSPYLEDGQKIILNPGRTGGALEFKNILTKNNCNADVIVAETQTFLFASRVTGSAEATIFGEKNRVTIAAFPSNRTRELDDLLEVLPKFSPVENVLKTSLDNIGAIFHPCPTLLNIGWIESTEGKFNYYQQGISDSVSMIMEKMDQERMKVARALGVDPISACDWMRLSYGIEGNNLYELLQNNYQYQGIKAPCAVNHRYLFEDVPMSLVPISSIADKFGIKTPTINLIIELAGTVLNTNFWKKGRTVKSLGISKLSKREILRLVNKGKLDNVRVLPGIKRNIYKKLDNVIYNKFPEYQKEVE